MRDRLFDWRLYFENYTVSEVKKSASPRIPDNLTITAVPDGLRRLEPWGFDCYLALNWEHFVQEVGTFIAADCYRCDYYQAGKEKGNEIKIDSGAFVTWSHSVY